MKNLDAHKYIKLVNFLNKKKKYSYFNLKYVKNEETNDRFCIPININKGKILIDAINCAHKNALTKIITDIKEFKKESEECKRYDVNNLPSNQRRGPKNSVQGKKKKKMNY
ncbi:ATP-dependent protease ATPase subunit ClpY [Plasmodium brasilianum]|uniref:ATP-dependent protease ATPase subunit ClpY n=1 Tax=Plasmodium brasilianum TaxID=5824 RepID=A0ACB9YCL1_PLABR|nr:ATP-dependent protease ATPase subunit ClpY [Plasmodium brasilianum]